MNVLKIETIYEAQKEKVKIKQKEEPVLPLTIAVPLSDDESIMHKLFDIVVNNQGKRELKILVKSKLYSPFPLTKNISAS